MEPNAESCVAAIVSNHNGGPGDWKRLSKGKDRDGNVVRLFEDRKTGRLVVAVCVPDFMATNIEVRPVSPAVPRPPSGGLPCVPRASR